MREIRCSRVAVVGGAGFLGSHMTNYLIDSRGCEVIVIDNLVAGRREFVHPKARFIHRDITGSERILFDLFKENKIEYVASYAAYPYVPDSYDRPIRVCDVNFMGAMKVINAAQEAGVKAILQVSSAEVYGSGETFSREYGPSGKIDEESPISPRSSYGVAKAAVDAWCQVRYREARTPVVVLRQFNAYGRNETHDYVIPTIISQLHRHGPTIRLGNNSSRDFMYAEDAVRVAVELLEKGKFGEVYNSGSEESIKVYDLANLIGRVMGFDQVQIQTDTTRMRRWDIEYLCSDNSRLNSTISYRPTTDMLTGLRHTIDSFARNGNRWVFEDASIS